MNTLLTRLGRLEHTTTGAGKLVVLRAGLSDDGIDEALLGAGLDPGDERNTIIILRALGNGTGHVAPAQIFYVQDLT